MSIKFSQFADYDPTLGEPGDMEGVGLQGGQNVRWPAWYFQSFEDVETSSTTPTDINPEVYLTRITSDGSGLSQIIRFPNNPGVPGKPHLVLFDTQANPSDVISVTGSGSAYLIYSPFNPGVELYIINKFRITPPTTSLTLYEGQGVYCEWNGENWCITGLINEPLVVGPTAFAYDWGSGPACPAILYQESDGSYNAVMDPTNPQFRLTVTASTNISNPTVVPGGVRAVIVNSTGLGGPGYVRFEGPAINVSAWAAEGIQHVVLGNRLNVADTILIPPANLNSSIRNADGSLFTSFEFANAMVVMRWDNVWCVDTGTNTVNTAPKVMSALFGAKPGTQGLAIARNGGTYTITRGEGYGNFSNFGGSEIYNLPAASQTGQQYSFSQLSSNLADCTLTVVVPAATGVAVCGRALTAPTFSTTQYGATISFRDISSPGYVVENITGAWSIT